MCMQSCDDSKVKVDVRCITVDVDPTFGVRRLNVMMWTW